MYRFRLLDIVSGADLGPFVSPRRSFQIGEILVRPRGERFTVREVVEPENENFRAYLVVSPIDAEPL